LTTLHYTLFIINSSCQGTVTFYVNFWMTVFKHGIECPKAGQFLWGSNVASLRILSALN
jgi:hypothetical protein